MVKPSPCGVPIVSIAAWVVAVGEGGMVEATEGVGAAVAVAWGAGVDSVPHPASPKQATTNSRTNLLNFKPVTSPLFKGLLLDAYSSWINCNPPIITYCPGSNNP